MSDALLSPAVGATMCAISTAAIAYSIVKMKKDDICEKKIPMIGVMGAFVFAAQMLNFAIPATGSSGHLVGGILLAAMIGIAPALLSISAILIVQCLFFADGGLLALGCNIFNMGVVPCLIVYPFVFKPLVKDGQSQGRIISASFVASIIALQIGAFCVVLETFASGVAGLPFYEFALLMQPIHLAIGIAEGLASAAVLCVVYKTRPNIAVFAIAALVVGGVLSMFASSNPDGLEWAIGKVTGVAFEAEEKGFGTAVSGIVGCVLTFLFATVAMFATSIFKRRRLLY
jgi:cobalt/nickel transport system permease protein